MNLILTLSNFDCYLKKCAVVNNGMCKVLRQAVPSWPLVNRSYSGSDSPSHYPYWERHRPAQDMESYQQAIPREIVTSLSTATYSTIDQLLNHGMVTKTLDHKLYVISQPNPWNGRSEIHITPHPWYLIHICENISLSAWLANIFGKISPRGLFSLWRFSFHTSIHVMDDDPDLREMWQLEISAFAKRLGLVGS